MRTALLLALVAAVAAAAAWMLTRPAKEQDSNRLLPGFAPEKAAAILIRSAEGNVTLALANGTWTVADRGGYPADGERVLRLVRTIWELRPVQSLPVAEADLPRLDLAAPGNASASENATQSGMGTSISFEDAEGRGLGGIILGKRHMREGQGGFPGMAVGRYVRDASSTNRAALVSETFDDAAPAPQTWLDKEFLKISKPVMIRYTPADNAAQGWELVMENGEWKLSGAKKGEKLDAAKIVLLTSSLGGLGFNDLGPASFSPSGKLEVATEEGVKLEFEIGPREGGDVPVRVGASLVPDAKEGASLDALQRFLGRVFLVPGFSLDSIAIERSKLIAEPSPTPTPTPAPPKPARRR